MSYVWCENTCTAENQMKNLLCHDEKCNNILDICCGLKTKVQYIVLWADVSSTVMIGATTTTVAVNQVFLHLDVCSGVEGLMLCWYVMYRQPALQGFILLFAVNYND